MNNMPNNEQLYAGFMKKLESLLIEYDAELQHDGISGISVDFIGTRPTPNVIGFWQPIGHHLYPTCDKFTEAENHEGDKVWKVRGFGHD